MKGFLFALVGDLLSINAIASTFLAGLELCINDLANKKGNKGFNILGVVLSVFALLIPSIAFS